MIGRKPKPAPWTAVAAPTLQSLYGPPPNTEPPPDTAAPPSVTVYLDTRQAFKILGATSWHTADGFVTVSVGEWQPGHATWGVLATFKTDHVLVIFKDTSG